MTVQTKHVLKEVLDLPPIERAEMVEQILASFDFPSRKQIDEAWAKEAEDRLDAYDRGDIKAIPAKKVFEKIDRQYSR